MAATESTAEPGRLFTANRDYRLNPHIDALPSRDFSLEARFSLDAGEILTSFQLTGPLETLAIPPFFASERCDELWRHTCFEVFFGAAHATPYLEYNLSPSGQWAAYEFASYRDGVRDLPVEAPVIGVDRAAGALKMTARLAYPESLAPMRVGLSAVLEEKSGHKSYWALAHPPGPPDFHHPDCFALELTAPARP